EDAGRGAKPLRRSPVCHSFPGGHDEEVSGCDAISAQGRGRPRTPRPAPARGGTGGAPREGRPSETTEGRKALETPGELVLGQSGGNEEIENPAPEGRPSSHPPSLQRCDNWHGFSCGQKAPRKILFPQPAGQYNALW